MKSINHLIRGVMRGVVRLASFSLGSAAVIGATVNAVYNSPGDVPVSAGSYTSAGNTVAFALNFAPATGTDLMVVQNTGLGFINGTFDNLTNGQPVALSFNGTNYQFVANYFGGTGNDLVLVWANSRVYGWGDDDSGQLGDGAFGTNRLVPMPVAADGVLAGKTVLSAAVGGIHSLALCSDSTVVAWGDNSFGQLGDNTREMRLVPAAVNTDDGVSALSGKRVVAVAAGFLHSLALCSDGTVAAWGSNGDGELGDTTTTNRQTPVAVNVDAGISALSGKSVVAVAAGNSFSLALCSDGTVAAWGYNYSGQLGNNGTNNSPVPVAVSTDTNSALYGKTVIAITAGQSHSLALCSDGTVVGWGANSGMLGDGTTTRRRVPVRVSTALGWESALYGKTVAAIAAGSFHSLALCSDGTLAAWGDGGLGQLGDNSGSGWDTALVPVTVNAQAGVSALYGRTAVGIAAGAAQNLVVCADGSLCSWGYNRDGQLGDNTTTSRSAAVLVSAACLAPGQRFTRVAPGGMADHGLSVVAGPVAPRINVTGNHLSIPNGSVTANLADGTDFGTVYYLWDGAATRTFAIQNGGWEALHLTGAPQVAVTGPGAADFTVTQQPASPLAGGASTTFQVSFHPAASGTSAATITIGSDDPAAGVFSFSVQGIGRDAYPAVYTTGSEVPLTVNGFTATGKKVAFGLNFAPPPGMELMVVNNTGLDFIHGTFDGLTNGQVVALTYNGVSYNFVANYYGGNGNDLVLVGVNSRAYAWGCNDYGQIGDNTTGTDRLLLLPVTATGVLAGKTVLAVAAGSFHSLALCADGTLAAWGYNSGGLLGDNTTIPRLTPVAVNRAAGVSALYGKTVAAVAAGGAHSLAVCSDGSVAAWGANFFGELGDTSTANRLVPVSVNQAPGSALYGKTAVAVAAGDYHSLALCSDGSVVAWGQNDYGQLGNNSTSDSLMPVAVCTDTNSALHGKTVVAIAAGADHSLALCADGTLVAWGDNTWGQLGDTTYTQRNVPTAVNTTGGTSALYGKTVTAITAGSAHSLALCSDGALAAWGDNEAGQVGDNSTADTRPTPVLVNTNSGVSALAGRLVVAITAGWEHSLALCADGALAAWGDNYYGGELGDNTTVSRSAPVLVNTNPLALGQRFALVASGPLAIHTLARVAGPFAPAMSVTGNGLNITNGSSLPNLGDGTDFGPIYVLSGGTVTRTFTIRNAGWLDLNLTGAPRVAISGRGAAAFTVNQPLATPVPGNSNTTFQLSFTPPGIGTFAAMVTITSDDPTANPYTFAIQGAGSSTLTAAYTTGIEVPLTINGFMASNSTVSFALNFAPPPGAELMVVKNTGLGFINGTFGNLTNGQVVALNYGGTNYYFAANYFGGSGNDLVLVWANNRALAWGRDNYGQLGDNASGFNRLLPVPVLASGLLAQKTVVAAAAGQYHTLALCSDGTLAAWGTNNAGQVGDGTTLQRAFPVAVNTSQLGGKQIVAISAGGFHSLALCSDGTVAAWGDNSYGQLGDNTTASHSVPRAVNQAPGSALYGKTVVAIAAGFNHSLALCSDGSVVAWGLDASGQLGDNGVAGNQSLLPVAVNTVSNLSALYSKTVVAIAAGAYHSLVSCSDGTLAAWGYNYYGQLGDNSSGGNRLLPVAVKNNGILAGRSVVAIAAGGYHSLALCSDGAVAAWGYNSYGQLGINSTTQQNAPALVNTNSGLSAIYSRSVVALGAGFYHSLALCADGTVAAWGNNPYGQVGDNTSGVNRLVPVAVSAAPLAAGERFARVFSGSTATHSLAVAAPPTMVVTAAYNSAADVPVTAAGYTAAGNSVNFTLNYAPLPGTELMVVKNTGAAFITGKFGNLAQGQTVALNFGGTNYYFAANYYGGTGNDLVLTWAKNCVFTWGGNVLVPTPVAPWALDGKTVLALAGGASGLALGADGTVAGVGAAAPISAQSGVSALYGKTVVAVAQGYVHSLALCADGTMVAWGQNYYGQLGDGTTTDRQFPVAVNTAGVLAGKIVTAISAGSFHNLALCSDGTVVAWGNNSSGKLGNNSTAQASAPVAVNTTSGVSALYGKTVVAVAAGGTFSLALCSDGTLAAWGNNGAGSLGNNTTNQSLVPVLVSTASGVSALYGKTVTAISVGSSHSLALCSDGTLAAWGYNYYGSLGDNTTVNRLAPVAVNQASGVSALFGKTVLSVTAGWYQTLALCSDGTMAAWGWNSSGQLGDNTTFDRHLPVAVSTNLLGGGERFSRLFPGSGVSSSSALVAVPPAPEIGLSGNGTSIANGEATPSPLDGTDFGPATTNATVVHTFAIQNTGWLDLHLTGASKVTVGGPNAADFTVTQQPATLVAGGGGATTFQVAFTPHGPWLRTATVTITNDDSKHNPFCFNLKGTGAGVLQAAYTTGNEVPLSVSELTAAGSTVNLTLNFAPPPGTELMVVKKTGLSFINGVFDNLTNGQPVALSFGGTNYGFVANYYGGSGNDLTLVWANNRLLAWGANDRGQLGDKTVIGRLAPLAVTRTGALAGKTVMAVAVGGHHSLALCADGTVAAWGDNSYGQLGVNGIGQAYVPVAVSRDPGVSALSGKTVAGIAAGSYHSLALCADGTVVAWGQNSFGQLGDNTTTNRFAPVAVNTVSGLSALAGETVVSVAAGSSHSLALCADGTVAAWGLNNSAQLGDYTTTTRFAPVAVYTSPGSSALAGETVVSVAAGSLHSLALCADGTVAAWGDNSYGQLGVNGTGQAYAPVAVSTASGVSALSGKAVAGIAAGSYHSLALGSDGTVVAWGQNSFGQLGDNTATNRFAPVVVNTDPGVSALLGKTVLGISGGATHSLALCSDGTVAAWGDNSNGQLGNNSTTNRLAPVAADLSSVAADERLAHIWSGSAAGHSLALVASPPVTAIPPVGATTLSDGSFQLSFANRPGASFSVLTATNPAVPLTYWDLLGVATEISPGQFQFTDPQPTNSPQRFYRVRSP